MINLQHEEEKESMKAYQASRKSLPRRSHQHHLYSLSFVAPLISLPKTKRNINYNFESHTKKIKFQIFFKESNLTSSIKRKILFLLLLILSWISWSCIWTKSWTVSGPSIMQKLLKLKK